MSSVEGHLIHTYIHTCLHTYTHIPTKNYFSIFENHQNPWFWGAYPLRIWERSKTDPSPKRVFRRWLFPLRMNRKLRFFECFNHVLLRNQQQQQMQKFKTKPRNAPDARARKKDFNLHLWNRARGPPPFTEGGPCARARARARAKYPGFSKLVFFVV